MLQDTDIVTIRQFCMDRVIAILRDDEKATLQDHLQAATELETWLMRLEDYTEAMMGRVK